MLTVTQLVKNLPALYGFRKLSQENATESYPKHFHTSQKDTF